MARKKKSGASKSSKSQHLKQLSVHDMDVQSTSKTMEFPRRPGMGTTGTRCLVKANNFLVELEDKDLHHYNVKITPEVRSKDVNRAVIAHLEKLSHLGKRLPAYDGRNSLYTAGPLPFTAKDFKITLDKDNGSAFARRKKDFKVVIELVTRIDLHHMEMFLRGRKANSPQQVLQLLDTVLRQLPPQQYHPVGRSFYSLPCGKRQSLGEGLEILHGFYQSLHPTQMGLSLNIDMSSTAFIKPLLVTEFVTQLLDRDLFSEPLSDSDRVKINEALVGVKVEVTHHGKMCREYRISGLTSQATRELNFPIDDKGTTSSVLDYFEEKYGIILEFTLLPCLQVGNQQRPCYLPMEVCKIMEGQRYSKRLREKQITKVTCQRPRDREFGILHTVHQNSFDTVSYAKEFGLKINDKLALVDARVLPAPQGYAKVLSPTSSSMEHDGQENDQWGSVKSWFCINFARDVPYTVASGFCSELARMCTNSGMDYSPVPVLPLVFALPSDVVNVLTSTGSEASTKVPEYEKLDLLVVILPDTNGTLYGDIKRICETELGIVSQCCLAKHVTKMTIQYMSNIALKINVKVGGRNTVLVDALSRRIPLVTDIPTIIFGADVTHPYPGDDLSPSIAAVVASQDWPEVTKYAASTCAQKIRQELIQDLYKEWEDPVDRKMTGGMVKELLNSFIEATQMKPQRIIFYRDGVSEGQYDQVLLHELSAIRKACACLELGYQPPITFVVVQKRHHTRLFVNDHNNRNEADRSGNIFPGTIVDSKICHPTGFDFYLCSHAGIQGTTRPARYHVLWDENKFTADGIQLLTNNLCYTYARCTRSVSIVPPVYYAHLAASRARFYMNPETPDSGTRSSSWDKNAVRPVRPLLALKDKVKKVMFYC